MPLYAATLAARAEPASLVRPMMGTGAAGCVVPVAAAPFGMVQLGPDTYFTSSGYHYDHDVIYGFSHTHKSGGGGTDFQDIMFFPVADSAWQRLEVYPIVSAAVSRMSGSMSSPGITGSGCSTRTSRPS